MQRDSGDCDRVGARALGSLRGYVKPRVDGGGGFSIALELRKEEPQPLRLPLSLGRCNSSLSVRSDSRSECAAVSSRIRSTRGAGL